MTVLLETERLAFRSWIAADLAHFCAICSEPRVMQFVGDGQPWSREQTQTFIERAIAHSQQHGYCQWALVLKNSAELIGFCGFMPAEAGAEIGWRLAHEHWGKGLATEAAQAAMKYGFEELGFPRVIATVQSGNQASLRVVEKLGMRQEGKMRRNGREVLVFSVAPSAE
jgi:RimJ/RimL family protein N-acetyltransferase